MRSKIYIVRSVVNRIKDVLDIIYRDKVSVYAAQASFFVITSSVPFISLLIAIFGLFLPEANDLSHLSIPIIEDVSNSISVIFSSIMQDLKDAPSVSLLSISAVTTLWTASRGIAAIRQGIETVYGTDKTSGYVRHRMTSILTTLLFIVSLTVITVLLLFGDKLINLISGYISVHLTDLFELLRMRSHSLWQCSLPQCTALSRRKAPMSRTRYGGIFRAGCFPPSAGLYSRISTRCTSTTSPARQRSTGACRRYALSCYGFTSV